MLRLTFAARIGLIALLAIALVWLVSVSLFYLSRHDGGIRPPPEQLAALAQLIERTPAAERPLVVAAVESDTLTILLEPGGDVGASSARPILHIGERTLDAYRAALDGRAVGVLLIDGRRGRPDAMVFRIALRTGETLVVQARSALLVTRLGLPIGLGAGLFGTVIALLALYVMQREAKPLARLVAAIDRIDLAGPPTLLPEARRSAPEIRALVDAFNRLQTRLSQLLKARLAMLGGISHDVRTFATRLRLRVDRIPDGPERARAVADIADMIRLLDDALLASRAGVGELAQELVEFERIVQIEVADGQARGAAIAFTGAGTDATILGDRLALRRIVANLIDNALKYGGRAYVGLASEDGSAVLTIDDNGPGIPPDQRELLLEPFVRLETSRSRRTGGAGLGLAVVRSLVEAHGGTIAIADAPTGGARVMVTLPVFRAS
jgi:signal transduction histidine kinase